MAVKGGRTTFDAQRQLSFCFAPLERRHVLYPHLPTRPRAVAVRRAARRHTGARQYRARRGAIRRAGVVRPYRRCPVGNIAGRRRTGGARAGAAGGRLGRFRSFRDLRGSAGCLVRRPAFASAPQHGAGGLFRARAAIAARLPCRSPFRPADEGDADRHRHAVVAVAFVLPRASLRLRLYRVCYCRLR